MNEELKVRSFRADNETFEKFKQLAEGEFGNQGQCLSALINLYETEKSKAILVNRGLEIESFQDYLNKISGLFLTSLQLNQDAEGRIREEFARQLESKDNTIIELQTKLGDLKTTKEAIEESSKLLQEDNKNLQSLVSEFKETEEKQLQEYRSTLADKDGLNKALTDSLNERKAEIELLKMQRNDTNEKLKELESLKTVSQQLKEDLNNLKNEIERQKDHAEISQEKALTALEKEHQQEIKKLNEQNNSKVQELLAKIEKMQEENLKSNLKATAEVKKDPKNKVEKQ